MFAWMVEAGRGLKGAACVTWDIEGALLPPPDMVITSRLPEE
jgi:hypothetical protein